MVLPTCLWEMWTGCTHVEEKPSESMQFLKPLGLCEIQIISWHMDEFTGIHPEFPE